MIYLRQDNVALIGVPIERFECKHRLKNILVSLDITDKLLCIVDCNTLPMRRNTERFPYDTVKELADEARSKGLKFVVIFENIHEAPTYHHNLKNYIDRICAENNIPQDKIIICSGAQTQPRSTIINSWTPMMATTDNVMADLCVETIPTHHFISLARIAKPHRVLATIAIWDKGLEKFGHLSLGSGYYGDDRENQLGYSMIPEKYRERVPAILDGIIAPGHLDFNQHRAKDPRITRAFVNLSMETSFDASVSPMTWNVPFISEKSMKPFAWGQVPLLVAPSNSLPRIRELGFDMFDDLIDHRYDLEPDPKLRIYKVIKQLGRMCEMPIEELQNYKRINMHRFLRNRATLWDLHVNKRYSITIDNLKSALDQACCE